MKGRNQWDSGVLSDIVGSLHSVQRHFWLPASYPIRQCSVHSSVFWPCKTSPWPLLWALSVCLSVLKSFPPSLPPSSLRSSQFLTDMSCSLSPLTISFSSLITNLLLLPALSISFFLLSALIVPFLGWHCQSWAPKPPHFFFPPSAPLLGFLPFPRLLVLIGSPPALCISINFVPPTDTTHRRTRNKYPELSRSPAHANCNVFYSKDSNGCLPDRESIMPFRAPALGAEHASAIKWILT